MHVAILTGGGDAPGLNGIIESASRRLLHAGCQVSGILDGFEGVFDCRTRRIELADVAGIHARAGTILGTSNRVGIAGREEEFLQKFKLLGFDALIVAGGDGTFAALRGLRHQLPLVGVPKTIDNDLSGTEKTFGFDTACAVVAEAVDGLRQTSEAHRRLIVVETMGRTAGWIALGGGLAAHSDVILIPERPFSRTALVDFVRAHHTRAQRGLMVVVSEGVTAVGEDVHVARTVLGSPEAVRLGGVGPAIANFLESETGWEARSVVLGHMQRARHPTAQDCLLTTQMGVLAADLVLDGRHGEAVVYRDGAITSAPISDVMGPARRVPPGHRWLATAEALGIFI